MPRNRERRRAGALLDSQRTRGRPCRHFRLSPVPKEFPSRRSWADLLVWLGICGIAMESTGSRRYVFAESRKSKGLFLHFRCDRTQSSLLRWWRPRTLERAQGEDLTSVLDW